MSFIIKDRVKEITTSSGTGAVSLAGASNTFDSFNSCMTDGDTTYYALVHTASGVDQWEVGLGTWNTGNTLTRTTVLAGSNGTSAENFSAGSKDVFMTYPAAHAALTGADVTFANIAATGTVDGRDVAADGTKLDTVSTNADVTPSWVPSSDPIYLTTVTQSDVTSHQAALSIAESQITGSTILKDADIGVNVQAYNANYVVDATYVATDQNFTTADHSKLDGIETGATADQTKSDIDALNINADQLDGQHGSYYTGYTDTAVADLVSSAPSTLDTLNELASALGDDPNFATTVTTSIATKLPLAGGTMTGDIDGNGNKVLFSNVYSTLNDLPSASSNHGMFAHVHATGKGYFAHAGSWVELANNSQISDENFTTADHSKLDGIETGADVTDTANVTSAGALMDSEVTNLAQVKAFDSSDYATAAQGTLADSAVQTNDSPTFSTVNVTTVDLGDWTITESSGVLYFATGGVNKMKLDASGNLTTTGNVTAFGTI